MVRFLAFLLFAPLCAQAQSACNALIPLAQIQYALEQVAEGPPTTDPAAMRRLGQISNSLDGAYVRYHLRGHTLAEHQTLFDQLTVAAVQVSTRHALGDPAGAAQLAQSPDFASLTRQMGRLLAPYPCENNNPERAGSTLSVSGDRFGTFGELPSWQRGAMASLGLSITLGGLCTILIQRQLRRIANRNRLERRFFVRIPTYVQVLGRDQSVAQTARILDLSCNGLKINCIALPNQKSDIHLRLMIEDTAHEAFVRWSNDHYCGLKFVTPISHDDVQRLHKTYPPRRKPQPLRPTGALAAKN